MGYQILDLCASDKCWPKKKSFIEAQLKEERILLSWNFLFSSADPDLIPPRPPFVVRLSNVKSNMELSGAIRWANKISTHQSLREKLHKLIMEEAKRKKRMERYTNL